ncbi:MAG: potassium channel family protein [Actinobacteria bacterium]|nr:potassium channel family protein [Actinomycetota bacterium]
MLTIPAVLLDANGLGDWPDTGFILNLLIWLAFIVEFIVMLAVVPSRSSWLRSHKLESFLVVASVPWLPAGAGVLRLLRLVRITRLSRTFKLAGSYLSNEGLPYATAAMVLVTVASGSAFSWLENEHASSQWDGIWWAVSTVMTVGYGDIAPVTDAGRTLAIGLMVIGIGFVALLTAAMARYFISEESTTNAQASTNDKVNAARHQQIIDQLEAIQQRLEELESPERVLEAVEPDRV